MKITLSLGYLLVLFCLGTGLISAQTVTNGSVTGSPAANSGINNGNAPGWSGCGFSPDLCNVTFPSYSGNSQVPRIASPDGGTWLGIAALGECAQTTITGLSVGTAYVLRFCGANFGTAALFNGSPAAPIISIVGGPSVTLSIPQVANTWNPYQLAFTATATTHTLRCSIPNGSNAYASLDGFNLTGALCNPVVLPIEFVDFEGSFGDCKVTLKWDAPISEFAKDYEIQRSPDGELFETLEKLNANGEKHGGWVDPFPLEAAYYRIRMYNETGRVAESPIIAVSGRCGEPELIVLGNPLVDQEYAVVKFIAASENSVVTLQDMRGRVMGTYAIATQAGTWNEMQLHVGELGAGIYLITTNNGAQAKLILR
jgi:hypothetical protein